jgi:hypothetical protein
LRAVDGDRRVLAAVVLFSLNPVIYKQLSLDPLTTLSTVNAMAALVLVAVSARRGRAAQLASEASRGRKRAFCSSVPKSRSALYPMLWCAPSVTAREPSIAAISWKMRA